MSGGGARNVKSEPALPATGPAWLPALNWRRLPKGSLLVLDVLDMSSQAQPFVAIPAPPPHEGGDGASFLVGKLGVPHGVCYGQPLGPLETVAEVDVLGDEGGAGRYAVIAAPATRFAADFVILSQGAVFSGRIDGASAAETYLEHLTFQQDRRWGCDFILGQACCRSTGMDGRIIYLPGEIVEAIDRVFKTAAWPKL